MDWKLTNGIGSGLINLGNTCYMNSVLQCLTYSPVFSQYLLLGEHSKKCKSKRFCSFCALESHAITCHLSSGTSIAPEVFAQNIREIARTFTIGNQEDAHEFMGNLINSLQDVCLSKHPKGTVAHRDSMTTVVGSMFGGYHRNQVKCSQCQNESNTFEPYMDLSLDIDQVDSLELALEKTVRSEALRDQNRYICSKCKQLVEATRESKVHISPPVLAIQFKLFTSTGQKINKEIQFGQTLNLSPYMTQPNDYSIYDLHAVLVHAGQTPNSGHYYCYVKGTNGIWYKMNDSSVEAVSLYTVLASKAYMVFYSKRDTNGSINTNTIEKYSGQKRKLFDESGSIREVKRKLN